MAKSKKNQPIPKVVAPPKNIVAKDAIWTKWLWIIPILFAALSFSPILQNELTNWDDSEYLTNNTLITHLDGATVKKIFTEPYFGNYQPLHILSYSIEYQLYKLNPKGYHATSLLLYLIMVGLVFLFLQRLSGNKIIAFIGTMLYAVSPMHVESVAWAAERKDTLYGIFFVSALISYLNYIRKNESIVWLLITLILFALSLLSKVMAVSIIGPLLMLDFWYGRKNIAKIILEKIPFVVGAIAIGIIQVKATAGSEAFSKVDISLIDRIAIACHNLLRYVVYLVYPIKLSNFHPYPQGNELPVNYYLAIPAVLVVLGLVVYSSRKTKIYLFSAGFFFSTLALVLMFFAVGPTIFSERYTYIPSIVFFFLVATFLFHLARKNGLSQNVMLLITLLISLPYAAKSYARCKVWNNSYTLWTDCLSKYNYVATGWNNLGRYKGDNLKDLDGALADLNNSIKYDPSYEIAYSNRGIVYGMKGMYNEALQDFNNALRLKPNYTEARQNRAIALMQAGKFDLALNDYDTLLISEPNNIGHLLQRGTCIRNLGKNEEAIAALTKVIQLDPNNSYAYGQRGTAYKALGDNETALRDLSKAIELNPNDAFSLLQRSNVYYNIKKYNEANADLDKGISLGGKPNQAFIDAVKAML
ncbi:MAG: tetratricopeptide repeat protein [Chitinophagales bacterium]|nr:tetratricopeptide repeat protein [Chitinophagales bacterium]